MAQRILVVEDNDLNRRLFCEILRGSGYRVESVSNGKDALPAAHAFVPNLLVMDIQLPDISGLAVIVALKEDANLRHVPVLAVTAYAGKGDEHRIREAGAQGYLSKPVSIRPFLNKVQELLATPV